MNKFLTFVVGALCGALLTIWCDSIHLNKIESQRNQLSDLVRIGMDNDTLWYSIVVKEYIKDSENITIEDLNNWYYCY